jgi:hypothetical protein
MRHLIAIVLILLLSSCIRIGDGAFMIQGELTGLPSGEKCLLFLSHEREEQALPWKSVEITGIFSDGFTVSPYSRNYAVRVSCNGHLVVSKFVNYPRDMGIGGTVDLGKINVQW